MIYPCSGCGACCRRVNVAVEHSKELDIGHDLSFPYGWDEDGVCEMLENNRCRVYENRPLICRIDDLQKIVGGSKKKFYKLTAKACNALIDDFNIDKSFKIKI